MPAASISAGPASPMAKASNQLSSSPSIAARRSGLSRLESVSPAGGSGETSPDDHRADRHRSGPGAASHLVHARDAVRPGGSQLALDLIPGPGPAHGGPDGRGLVPEGELFHSRHDGLPAAGRHGESPQGSANRRAPRR